LHDESIDVISNFKQGKLGTLKLALTGSTGYWLLSLLDNFRRSNNNVIIDIHVSFFDTIMDRIITRKAHFGFIKADAPNFSHPLLFSKVFAMDESILVFSANHRFSKLEKITLVDICEEALVAYGSKTSFWQQILVEFNKVGLNPKIYADAYDYQTVKLLLQTSYGVAFLPKICVNEELEKGILKTLPIKDCAPIHRHSILIYRKDMVFNPLYERFISILFAKAYSM
jgi:DNA-binding transcriptional LysR family regulator